MFVHQSLLQQGKLVSVHFVVHPARDSSLREGVPPPVLSVARFQETIPEAVARGDASSLSGSLEVSLPPPPAFLREGKRERGREGGRVLVEGREQPVHSYSGDREQVLFLRARAKTQSSACGCTDHGAEAS